ncbi:MAG TPA: type II toxin-antitoxin system death-on-curing family toxin [Thermoanaerobaculia bacterium]
MREPVWVERIVVEAVHLDQLREHGGLYGLRDENALESALARARNKWAYDSVQDIATLAAAYGYGLATNHPYQDGNKRISFLITVVFLGLNGWDFEAPEEEVVTVMLAVASNRCSEAELANWIRSRIVLAP